MIKISTQTINVSIILTLRLPPLIASDPTSIPKYAVFDKLKIEIDIMILLINHPTGNSNAKKKNGVEFICSNKKVSIDKIGSPQRIDRFNVPVMINKTA